MRALILTPIVLVLVAAGGASVGWAAGWAGHGREMLTAGVIALLATEMVLVPMVFVRRADQATVVQAALAGSGGHLLLTLMLGGVAWALGLFVAAEVFALWLLVFYWASLAVLAASLISAVRSAQPAGSAGVDVNHHKRSAARTQ